MQKPSTDTLGSTASCTHWIQTHNCSTSTWLYKTHDGVLDQLVSMQVLSLHDAYILNTLQRRTLDVVAMPVSTF